MTYEELEEQNRQLKDQILILTQQLDWLKRQLFGRKGEQLDHPDLFGGQQPGKQESPGDVDAPEDLVPSSDSPNPKNNQREKRPRKIRKERLPADLPVRTEEIIPEFVQANPTAWRNSGFEEKTQLEKEPAYFYLRRILRLKFVPIDNPFSPPVIEPAKPTMIEGGFWGPGILAEILANKYLYHLPFDRQHVLNKQRYGIDLSPNTMGDVAAKVADQCGLLVGLMKQHMLESGYVRADETFIRYLDKCIPGGSSTGYFWVYRGLTGEVIFDWQTSREHRHVSDWLGPDYQGILQSDGYQAYENYCRAQKLLGKKVIRASCLAHIRRKFENARAERPEVIDWILRIIARLYLLETPLREYGADAAARLRVRHNRSQPLIHLLEKAFKRLIATPYPTQKRPRSSAPIRPWPMARHADLPPRRPRRDRQQRDRERHPAKRRRQEKLAIRRQPRSRQTFRSHVYLAHQRPQSRRRSASLPPSAYRTPPQHPDRRTRYPTASHLGRRQPHRPPRDQVRKRKSRLKPATLSNFGKEIALIRTADARVLTYQRNDGVSSGGISRIAPSNGDTVAKLE